MACVISNLLFDSQLPYCLLPHIILFFNREVGSETSAWITDVVIRHSNMSGTDRAVRIKSCRGRGGGAKNITYLDMTGEVDESISLTLKYVNEPPTNWTATPEIHDVKVSNLELTADKSYMLCDGLPESPITGISMDNVTVDGDGAFSTECWFCHGTATTGDVTPEPCFTQPRSSRQTQD